MGTLFELLGLIGNLLFPFTKNVTEEQIERRILDFLRNINGFKNILKILRLKI